MEAGMCVRLLRPISCHCRLSQTVALHVTQCAECRHDHRAILFMHSIALLMPRTAVRRSGAKAIDVLHVQLCQSLMTVLCSQGGSAFAASPMQPAAQSSAPAAQDSAHAAEEGGAAAAERRAARLAAELEEAIADANVARAELASEICNRQVCSRTRMRTCLAHSRVP